MNVTIYSNVHAVKLYTKCEIAIYCNHTEKVCDLYISDEMKCGKINTLIRDQKVCSIREITDPVNGIIVDFKTVTLTCQHVMDALYTTDRYSVIGVVYK